MSGVVPVCELMHVFPFLMQKKVKRIEELDRVREAESGRSQEGRQRLQRLQQEAVAGAQTVSDRPADAASEVVRLQDQVAHFQAQLATKASEGGPCHSGLPRRQFAEESVEERSSPTRRFHVPVEELIQWINASPTSRTPSRQALQPKSAGWQV